MRYYQLLYGYDMRVKQAFGPSAKFRCQSAANHARGALNSAAPDRKSFGQGTDITNICYVESAQLER
jgi:hypothetical protein